MTMKHHAAHQDNPNQRDQQPGAQQSERLSGDNPWRPLEQSLDMFTEDFMDDREQPETTEEREPL